MGKLHAKGYTAVGTSIKWILDPHTTPSNCPYPTTESIHDILRDCHVVSICSPSSTHVDWAEHSFKAGIHTFIEKPLALTADDCTNLVNMHKRSGLSFRAGVGHIERFNPAFQVLLENIHRVGKIQVIEALRTNPSSGRISDADVVSDLTVHDLDLMRAICGGHSLDNVVILDSQQTNTILDSIIFEATISDIIISVHTSRISTESHRLFTVHGTKGSLCANLAECTLSFTATHKDILYIPVQPCDQIISQMGAWITAVQTATKPIVGLTDGLFAVKACDTIKNAVYG